MNLGMTEIMIIMVIALIVFGPRKLPELGKSLGQALAQFRRASDDFKRTWEQEVEIEKTRTSPPISTESTATSEQPTDDPYPHEDPYDFDAWRESGNDNAGQEAAAETATGSHDGAEVAPEPEVVAVAAEPLKSESESRHWI